MPPNFCPNCGIKIKADYSECCPKCGVKIGSKSPQTPPPLPPSSPIDSSSQIPNPREKNGVAEIKGNKRNWFNIAILLIGFVIVSAVFAYVVLGAGFFTPQTSQSNVVTTISTPTPTPASYALVPLPTQLIPTGKNFYFQVQKNPITSKISVIFTGSAGEGSVSRADIKVTHKDGSVTTGILLPVKGVTEITFDGSKETDRVEIIAKMSSGETYRVYDELVPSL